MPVKPRKTKHDLVKIKGELLEMAVAGMQRPSSTNHQYGRLLSYLTCASHPYHDHEFNSKIRSTRPEWFDPMNWTVGRKRKFDDE